MKKLILSAIFCLLINNVIASTSDNFSWESATVYFVITDRFCNGDTTNDVNYGRSVDYGTEQLPHAYIPLSTQKSPIVLSRPMGSND